MSVTDIELMDVSGKKRVLWGWLPISRAASVVGVPVITIKTLIRQGLVRYTDAILVRRRVPGASERNTKSREILVWVPDLMLYNPVRAVTYTVCGQDALAFTRTKHLSNLLTDILGVKPMLEDSVYSPDLPKSVRYYYEAKGKYDYMVLSVEEGLRTYRNLAIATLFATTSFHGALVIVEVMSMVRAMSFFPFHGAWLVDTPLNEWRRRARVLHSVASMAGNEERPWERKLYVVYGVNCPFCKKVFASPSWREFIRCARSIGKVDPVFMRIDEPEAAVLPIHGFNTPILIFFDPGSGRLVIWNNNPPPHVDPESYEDEFVKTNLGDYFIHQPWIRRDDGAVDLKKSNDTGEPRRDRRWEEVFMYLFNTVPYGARDSGREYKSGGRHSDEEIASEVIRLVEKYGVIESMPLMREVASTLGASLVTIYNRLGRMKIPGVRVETVKIRNVGRRKFYYREGIDLVKALRDMGMEVETGGAEQGGESGGGEESAGQSGRRGGKKPGGEES